MIILVLHPWGIVREGLRQVLTLELGEATELLEPKDVSQAVRWVSMYSPRCALVNPRAYPGVVATLASHIPVIVYTKSVDPDEITQAIQDGASGWVNVQDDLGELVNVIESVLQGIPVLSVGRVRSVVSRLTRIHQEYLRSPTPLSTQELKVLCLVARGHTNGEIAETLVTSTQVVKNIVHRVFTKLGVRNRVEATLRAWRSGLVPVDPDPSHKGDE